MATKKPRITVTLDQESYEALEQVSQAQGASMSSVLADVWREASPVMLRVVKLLREAQAAKDGVGDRIREIAVEAELTMVPMARELISNLDMFEHSVGEALRGTQQVSEGVQKGGDGK